MVIKAIKYGITINRPHKAFPTAESPSTSRSRANSIATANAVPAEPSLALRGLRTYKARSLAPISRGVGV
jgi:hypothetical protein